MSYELWDTETGNLVEAFEDEPSALRAARELIALNSDVYPEMLTLLAVSQRGERATRSAYSPPRSRTEVRVDRAELR